MTLDNKIGAHRVSAELSTEKQPASEGHDEELSHKPVYNQGLEPWLYVLAGFFFYLNTS